MISPLTNKLTNLRLWTPPPPPAVCLRRAGAPRRRHRLQWVLQPLGKESTYVARGLMLCVVAIWSLFTCEVRVAGKGCQECPQSAAREFVACIERVVAPGVPMCASSSGRAGAGEPKASGGAGGGLQRGLKLKMAGLAAPWAGWEGMGGLAFVDLGWDVRIGSDRLAGTLGRQRTSTGRS
ncbi:hypothetical protein DFH27DRAFT_544325 [Peziza echinospora]|nr:hypothetical protein DFH27DRAFT_544325 [Peziza echinospora]